jgi:5-methylcytosine-specific restriction endonuclease McrA
MQKARRRNRDHVRRSAVSDVTPAQELAMRAQARKCPLCGLSLTSAPNQPRSKHLDHIIPIAAGGTHTHGNVRIICAACNVRRPKDGSDYSGPVTLWAQGTAPIGRPDRRPNTATCRNGLHLWVPENIEIINGNAKCSACYRAGVSARSKQRGKNRWQAKPPTTVCRCGALYAAPGRTMMCPECTDRAGREAAELHKSGLTWSQVAAAVGYGTGEGARYAAKRTGYVPERPMHNYARPAVDHVA